MSALLIHTQGKRKACDGGTRRRGGEIPVGLYNLACVIPPSPSLLLVAGGRSLSFASAASAMACCTRLRGLLINCLVAATVFSWDAGRMAGLSRGQLLCDLKQIEVSHVVLVNATAARPAAVAEARWRRRYSVFVVRVVNKCPCSAAAEVTFFCDGFTQAAVRPELLRVDGPRCLLINGEAVLDLQPIRFRYHAPRQLPLQLQSADFTC